MVLAPADTRPPVRRSAVLVQVLRELAGDAAAPCRVPNGYELAGLVRHLAAVVLDQDRRLSALEAANPEAAAPEPDASKPPPAVNRPSRKARAHLGDLIDEVLDGDERWWTVGEIRNALNASGGLAAPLSAAAAAVAMGREWERRGWERRDHPDGGTAKQYRKTSPAGVEDES